MMLVLFDPNSSPSEEIAKSHQERIDSVPMFKGVNALNVINQQVFSVRFDCEEAAAKAQAKTGWDYVLDQPFVSAAAPRAVLKMEFRDGKVETRSADGSVKHYGGFWLC